MASAAALPSNKVLLVGSSGVGKKYILQKLTGAEQRCTREIHTKYFSCQLNFQLVTAEDFSFDEKTVKSVCADLGAGCEGVIFVFDEQKAPTFEAIEKWKIFVDQFQPSGLWCLSNAVSAVGSANAKLASRAVDFAFAHGMELVQVPFADQLSTVSNALLSADSDANGVTRVVQALTCTQWSAFNPAQKPAKEETKDKEAIVSVDCSAECKLAMKDVLGEEEKDLDEFEKMLEMFRGAKQHAQTLPDAERREYAAKMAMQLMSMIEESEEDEGEKCTPE